MAEIPVEKKSSLAWLWILLAILLIGLLIWWALDDDEVEPVTPPAIESSEVAPLPEPIAQSPGQSIADIMGNPAAFVGQSFSPNSVRVADVPTDRGFWIEDNGARMMAVIIDRPGEGKNINPGQMLRIREGILRDATFLQGNEIPGDLDADTRRILQAQPIFLVVEGQNIEILGKPGGAATADPADPMDPAQAVPVDR